MSKETLLVGADVGGTSTTVAVVDGARVVGRATGAGGNIRSSTGSVVEHLARALASAVPPRRRAEVGTAVLGIAGAGPAREAEVGRLVRTAWREAGLPTGVTPAVVTDVEVAFAAGTDDPDGVLLLAGTGAVACRFAGGHPVARCDGMGWLLGDEGSGVWIGTAVLRAVAADLDGRGPSTSLTQSVLELIGTDAEEPSFGSLVGSRPTAPTGAVAGDTDHRQSLIRAVDGRAPAWFGRFAPLAGRAAVEGDAVAGTIVASAVQSLLRTARVVGGEAFAGTLVLGGSVLTTPGPLADGVRQALGRGNPAGWSPRVLTARVPVLGALVLAGRAAGLPLDRAAVAAALAAR